MLSAEEKLKQQLDRLARLSGLSEAERLMVAHWRSRGSVPPCQITSFCFMYRKHCGRRNDG